MSFDIFSKKGVDIPIALVYYSSSTVENGGEQMHFNSRVPIYIQVIDDLKKKIIKGELKPGEKLPSSRELALEYEVNPNTAARIYKEMEQMELCYVERGKGTFISSEKDLLPGLRNEVINTLVDDFIEQMSELGFSKQEIIGKISDKEIK